MATRYKQDSDIKLYVENPKGLAKALEQDNMISKHFNIDHIEEGLILIYLQQLEFFSSVSCSDIFAIFMYCKPASDNVFYFINKVLLFYQYMRNGSRVMMCLCDIKSYINAQFFLSRTEINFYFTPKHNTIFYPSQTTYKKALCLPLKLIHQLPPLLVSR